MLALSLVAGAVYIVFSLLRMGWIADLVLSRTEFTLAVLAFLGVLPFGVLPGVIDGLVVFRQEAPVVFLNARRMTDSIRDVAAPGIDVAILDRTTISTIDSTGYAALQTLRDDLDQNGIEMWVVNPTRAKRAEIDNEAAVLGDTLPDRFESLDAAIAAFERRTPENRGDHAGDRPE